MGLCLLLEVRSQRVGDPDMLSSRVQSEVYALPPLPTASSTRRLSGPEADDQIERFIQRLDHLRFAVCGDHHATDLGRCVLVTSTVGGEGKTTLAATGGPMRQRRNSHVAHRRRRAPRFARPAARCPRGRRADSDVLNGAKFDDVVVQVQGGTFDLLCAGTPVTDTTASSRGKIARCSLPNCTSATP